MTGAATGPATGPTAGPTADLAGLTAAHNTRLAAVDPLLPPLPVPALAPLAVPAPAYGTMAQELLTVPGAAGVARTSTVDPERLESCWATLRSHQLVMARAGGADGPAAARAMAGLLGRWQEQVAGQPAGELGDTSVVLTWPSRDTVMTQLFLRHGLTPAVVVAARPRGRSIAGSRPPGEVTIRPLQERDIDAATALQLAVVSWDAQFGGVYLRPSTPARSRDEVLAQLGADPVKSWVAERDGAVLGYVSIEWPGQAGWVSAMVAGNPDGTAYLGCMSVQAGRRGGGIGAALAAHVHEHLDAAGVQRTLLHHAALNPLSAPFWARCGYRPLWTSWEAVPHTALR